MVTKLTSSLKMLGKQFEAALSLDLRSMALARISMGIIILTGLLSRLPDLTAHYSDTGVLSRIQVLQHYPQEFRWSLNMISGSPEIQLILFVITGVFALMLILGWHTKLATVASWILMISIHNRNPMVLNAGDTALTLILFWAMFLPWGEYFSLDARAKKVQRKLFFSVASFAYILQLVMLYLFSVIYKSGVEWTQDFTALYYSIAMDQFTTPFGYVLFQFKGLMKLFTFAAIKYEVIGPLLFFVPFFSGAIRTVAALGLITLHVGIALTLDVGIFSFVMMAFSIGILGSFFWDSLLPDLAELTSPLIRKLAFVKKALIYAKAVIYKLPVTHPRILSPKKRILLNLSVDIISGFFLVYILLWNISGLPTSSQSMPRNSIWIADMFRLDQKWNMFSPHPPFAGGWYLVTAVGDDGIEYDLLTNSPASRSKPELVSAQYPTQRWRKYMMNLYLETQKVHRKYYLNYMCQEWSRYPRYKKTKLNLIFMLEQNNPDTGDSVPQELTLESINC